MNNENPIIAILKILFVLGFILIPTLIKALSKRAIAKNSSLTPEPTKQNKMGTARQTQRKTFVKPKARTQKNVDDILAKIFGVEVDKKPSVVTQKHAPTLSQTRQQVTPKNRQHSIKAKKEELPRFQTSIKEFKTSAISLPPDTKNFNPNIHTETEFPKKSSSFIQKFKEIDREELRYGIVISEILGPPVSLK